MAWRIANEARCEAQTVQGSRCAGLYRRWVYTAHPDGYQGWLAVCPVHLRRHRQGLALRMAVQEPQERVWSRGAAGGPGPGPPVQLEQRRLEEAAFGPTT